MSAMPDLSSGRPDAVTLMHMARRQRAAAWALLVRHFLTSATTSTTPAATPTQAPQCC